MRPCSAHRCAPVLRTACRYFTLSMTPSALGEVENSKLKTMPLSAAKGQNSKLKQTVLCYPQHPPITQYTPMADADDMSSLQAQLAAHRQRLAILLRQVAIHGAAYAPPAQISDIAQARAEIARLKAALRNVGVEVEDQAGDEATPDEVARAQSAPAIASPYAARDVNIATNQTIFNVSHPQSRPTIDPAQAQQQLDALPLDQIPDPAPLPPGSRMPLSVNPLFVGREDDLKTLAATLKAGTTTVIAAATGMGGIGKTQLASEFVHRYGRFFMGGVFWLSFADPSGIDSEITACGGAGALELYTDASGLTQAEQVARVYAEWMQPLPRLLILDNCDDTEASTAEALLAQHTPRSGSCRVLVTSRRGHWRKGLGIGALPLGVLSRTESIALLRSHRDDISAADAGAIAELLGDLPLALSLAGSYLEQYADEMFGQPATYLANLKKQLLSHRSLSDAERSVRATFELSYQRLNAADPVDTLAIMALARAAHLAPGEPFPRALLLATLGDATDDEEIGALRADALRRLVALGLLELAEGGALRIHRLIAAFAREVIDDDTALAVIERTLSCSAYQINITGYPMPMEPILAHLRHAAEIAVGRADQQAATLASNLGFYLQLIADYAGAKLLFEQALQISEQVWGPQHLDTARCLNNLARLLQIQGDYTGARPLFERALAIIEQRLGPEHHQTVSCLNNLAGLLEDQRDYAGAESLYERALAITKQAQGPTHPDTAQSLNNLAGVLQNRGNYSRARSLYEEALSIYEQVLGLNHPNTAIVLNNLGYLLRSQGDAVGAKPLYERALVIYEQALGPQHPDVAQCLNNLAYLLQLQGDYVAARALYERARSICELRLGVDHPTTRTIRANLAALDAPPPTAAQ